MPLGRFALAALLLVQATACGHSVELAETPNPVPVILATEPGIVVKTGATTAIEIRGLGFVEGAEVQWQGAARITTFMDSTRVGVSLGAADLATIGAVSVTVVNPEPGGGASQPLLVSVGNPLPTLSSINPSTITTGSAQAVLVIQGSDFATGPPGAVATWDGIQLSTTVTSPTQLSANVPDYLLRRASIAAIAVGNPAPGGGVSGALLFHAENPVAQLTATDPVGVRVDADVVLGIIGQGFVYNTEVLWGGTRLSPESVTATRITVRVPGSLNPPGAPIPVQVESPGPGGGLSNSLDVPVWELPPQIDSLAPAWRFAGSPTFDLAIHGADFDPAGVVEWSGQARSATVTSPTRIDLTVDAGDVTAPGSAQVKVVNPASAGEASAPFAVLPTNPTSAWVAYIPQTGGRIVVSDIDGSVAASSPLPVGGHVDASPALWSAAYAYDGRVYIFDLTTGLARRLTTAASPFADEQWPRFSSDGVWVYYTGSVGGLWQAWRTRTDGTGTELARAEPGVDVLYPSPSHSGTQIVYSRAGGLRVLDLDTAADRPLGVSGSTARWSPNDEWIAYRASNETLHVIRPDGTQDRSLSSLQVHGAFDWSANGAWIIAVTSSGETWLIWPQTGAAQRQPQLGSVNSIAFFGRP